MTLDPLNLTPEQVLRSAIAALNDVDIEAAAELALKLNKLLQGRPMDVVVVASVVLALNVARVALQDAAVRPDLPRPKPEVFLARVAEQLALSTEFAEAFGAAGGVSQGMGIA